MDAFALLSPDRGHHPGDRVARTRSPARSTWAASSGRTRLILVNLSGRGDKDIDTAAKWFGLIGEGQSAEDADGTAIAQSATGRRRPTSADRGSGRSPSPAADVGTQP